MAKHNVSLTLPPQALGGRDLIFVVDIDDKKVGELHISQGGLVWHPAYAKRAKHSKSWTELRAFMEDNS